MEDLIVVLVCDRTSFLFTLSAVGVNTLL